MTRIALSGAVLCCVAVVSVHAQALHPDTSDPEWSDLFAPDLSDAVRPAGVWSMKDGVLTASEDQVLWTGKVYDSFLLDLEFRTAEATNSGVFVYASHLINWVPHSVEIQIADDYAEQWANAPDTWHTGAVFGHLAPTKSAVKQPGAWNRMTITCRDELISVPGIGLALTFYHPASASIKYLNA